MPKNAPKKMNSKEARRKAKTRLKMLVFPKMAKTNKAKKRKEDQVKLEEEFRKSLEFMVSVCKKSGEAGKKIMAKCAEYGHANPSTLKIEDIAAVREIAQFASTLI